METVGAFEAKTHLPKLLKLVARGDKVVITKHGVPVAVLQPPAPGRAEPVKEVILKIRAFRRKHRLAGDSLKEMVSEGRR